MIELQTRGDDCIDRSGHEIENSNQSNHFARNPKDCSICENHHIRRKYISEAVDCIDDFPRFDVNDVQGWGLDMIDVCQFTIRTEQNLTLARSWRLDSLNDSPIRAIDEIDIVGSSASNPDSFIVVSKESLMRSTV